jgi:hypothetical protein
VPRITARRHHRLHRAPARCATFGDHDAPGATITLRPTSARPTTGHGDVACDAGVLIDLDASAGHHHVGANRSFDGNAPAQGADRLAHAPGHLDGSPGDHCVAIDLAADPHGPPGGDHVAFDLAVNVDTTGRDVHVVVYGFGRLHARQGPAADFQGRRGLCHDGG